MQSTRFSPPPATTSAWVRRWKRELQRFADEPGLTVICDIDRSSYPKGIEVSDAEMAALNITRDAFHGEWNYTLSPRQQPSL